MQSIRSFACILLLASTISACESSIHDPEPVEVPAQDRIAVFDGVTVELTKVNYSWMPPAGPIPVHGERLVTLEITVENVALEPRTIHPSEFRLRTWDGTRRYHLSNTTTWMAQAGGRQPSLDRREIENGEGLRQWLTYRIPQGISSLPDAFLWNPAPDLLISFSLPTHSGTLVCGVGRIFGRVTDSSGLPVAAAPVELAFFRLSLAGNSFEGGRCRGRASSSTAVTTNHEGRYEDEVISRFCDELCVQLTAFASTEREPSTVQVPGGTIIPSPPHPLVEPSELRIDVVVPDVPPDQTRAGREPRQGFLPSASDIRSDALLQRRKAILPGRFMLLHMGLNREQSPRYNTGRLTMNMIICS